MSRLAPAGHTRDDNRHVVRRASLQGELHQSIARSLSRMSTPPRIEARKSARRRVSDGIAERLQRELLEEFERESHKDTSPESAGFFARVKDFFEGKSG